MPRFTIYDTIGAPPAKKQDRPRCKWCGKPLDPVWRYTFTPGTKLSTDKPTREFTGVYGKGEGNFCLELHAMWWADLTIRQIKERKIHIQGGMHEVSTGRSRAE